MDTRDTEQRCREAYLRGMLKELEGQIYQRTLKKAEIITRSMQPGEKAEYLRSKAFQNALNQTRKKDRLYQSLAQGELPPDYEAEYRRLRPLIEASLSAGRKADLHFLKSVLRVRCSLRDALQAQRILQEGKPRASLQKNAGRIAGRLDREIMRYLSAGDLSHLIRREELRGSVVESLLKTVFRSGLPERIVDEALPEGSLSLLLEKEILEAYPVLGRCRALRLEEGGSVESAVRNQARESGDAVLRALRSHFPQGRLRRHLKQNQALQSIQRQRERTQAEKKNLKEALLKAIPAEMKDLYPLARRMHRRFILHLGPTNSGKTWESIQRLQTARRGIYLGPLRLLAFEQFETLNVADVPCSLVTGEERISVPNSRIQSSTIEMADLETEYDIAVIDECQMISDRDRGGAWSAAVLGLCAEEIHLCASPDAERLLTAMILDCGDEMTVVRHERMAPLVVEESGFHFPSGVRRGS